MHTTINLALDWTANTNHIGFFIAQEKGFYNSNKLDVNIITPNQDNYATTPAKKVELGLADMALCPTESVISYLTKETPFPLIGICTILLEDLSAIVVRKDSNILSPKDLDRKTYASYKARYEDNIVRQMIVNDGGNGDIIIKYPEKLGIWETVTQREYDATWIFTNWEGIQAQASKIEMRYFKMKDYNVPYSYSPLLVANFNKIKENREVYRSFLEATKKGYLFAKSNEQESLEILRKFIVESDSDIDLKKSLKASLKAFGNEQTWGKIDPNVISEFLQWIVDNKLESKSLKVSDIFTNELL